MAGKNQAARGNREPYCVFSKAGFGYGWSKLDGALSTVLTALRRLCLQQRERRLEYEYIKQGRKSFYAYSAVRPGKDEAIALFMPRASTDITDIFLKEMEERPKGRHRLRNRFHKALKEAGDAVQERLRAATPEFLKSLCRCDYLLQFI